jgi:hypothetical protein
LGFYFLIGLFYLIGLFILLGFIILLGFFVFGLTKSKSSPDDLSLFEEGMNFAKSRGNLKMDLKELFCFLLYLKEIYF